MRLMDLAPKADCRSTGTAADSTATYENAGGSRMFRQKKVTQKRTGQKKIILGIWLLFLLTISACAEIPLTPLAPSASSAAPTGGQAGQGENDPESYQPGAYDGEASFVVNNNVPYFTEKEITTEVFETYSDLDSLGRCGTAFANVCREIMPTEERGNISNIRPSGWHTAKYDMLANRYLYNRCHLIGYQLAGENANKKNLITGTRYLNVEGMLPWENMVADYVRETGNHVLYRVTPYFEEENLVAYGVQMEAYSVEDQGAGVCFNVYCYNVQPGIVIDYRTGESKLDEAWLAGEAQPGEEIEYVLNVSTMRFHLPSCTSVSSMEEKNKEIFSGSREALIADGYIPCSRCNP